MVKKETYPHELIGHVVEIVDSTNLHDIGFVGTIIDETKNTIRVMKEGKVKVFLKQNVTLKMEKNIFIKGKEIKRRSEDRVKG